MSHPENRIPRSIAIPASRVEGDKWLQRLDMYVKTCCRPEGLPRHLDARKIYRALSRSNDSVERADHAHWKDFRRAQSALLEWMKGKKHWKENPESREYKKIPDFGGPEAIVAFMIIANEGGRFPQQWAKEWAEMRLGHVLKDIGEVPVDPFWKGAKLEVPGWRKRHFKEVENTGAQLTVTSETRLPGGFRKDNKKDVLTSINDWARTEGYTFLEVLDEDDPVFNREGYGTRGGNDAGDDDRSTIRYSQSRLGRLGSSASRSGARTGRTSRRSDLSEEARLERRGLVTPTRRQPLSGGTSLLPLSSGQRQPQRSGQSRARLGELREHQLDEEIAIRRRQREVSGLASQPDEPVTIESSPSPPSKVAKKTRKWDRGPGELARQTPREGGTTSGPPTNKSKSTNRLTENNRPTPSRSVSQSAQSQLISGPSLASPLPGATRPRQAPKPTRASVASSSTPAPKKTSAAKPSSPARDSVAQVPKARSFSRSAASAQPQQQYQPVSAPVVRPALFALPPAFNPLPPRPEVVVPPAKVTYSEGATASPKKLELFSSHPQSKGEMFPAQTSYLPAAPAVPPIKPVQRVQPAATTAAVPVQPAATPVVVSRPTQPAAAPTQSYFFSSRSEPKVAMFPAQTSYLPAAPAVPPIQSVQPAFPAATTAPRIQAPGPPAQPAPPAVVAAATPATVPVQPAAPATTSVVTQQLQPAAAPTFTQLVPAPAPAPAPAAPVAPVVPIPKPIINFEEEEEDDDLILIKPDPSLEAEKARIKKHYLSHLGKKYGTLDLLELFDYLNTLSPKFWEGPMDAAVYQSCVANGPKDHNGQPVSYQWPVVLRVLQEMFRKMGVLTDDNKLVRQGQTRGREVQIPRFEADDVFGM